METVSHLLHLFPRVFDCLFMDPFLGVRCGTHAKEVYRAWVESPVKDTVLQNSGSCKGSRQGLTTQA